MKEEIDNLDFIKEEIVDQETYKDENTELLIKKKELELKVERIGL